MEVALQPTRRKRGNNEGSIRKRRDGRWEAQYSVKRHSDGKTVRRSLKACVATPDMLGLHAQASVLVTAIPLGCIPKTV